MHMQISACAHGSDALAFSRFAESSSELAIDGRGLRLAFESIDNDGSEQITPPELFEALSQFDASLSMEQVVEYISKMELEVAGDVESPDAQDHVLDFSEFAHLFPQRMQRVRELESRWQAAREQVVDFSGRFVGLREGAADWVESLELVRRSLGELKGVAIEHFRANEVRHQAVDGLHDHLKSAHERLQSIPGPQQLADVEGKRGKASQARASRKDFVLGFDSFLQDHGFEYRWPGLVAKEVRVLSRARAKKEKGELTETDYLRAYENADTAAMKLTEVLEWVRGQTCEYDAFVDVFDGIENRMPSISMSGRGLQKHADLLAEGAELGPTADAPKEARDPGVFGYGEAMEGYPFRCLCPKTSVQRTKASKVISAAA
mmetsp:Transcript_75004/g.232811  ORF Transcript_75004/g.232811 Transcript_75004/m.232811 type:complete len:377 (+) Transcript_75004:1-1131(+)